MALRDDTGLGATAVRALLLTGAGYAVLFALYAGREFVTPTTVVVGLLVVGAALATLYAPLLVLRAVGARRVDSGEFPRFVGTLRRLARAVDTETPGTAVVDSDEPNAFTVGGGRGATVCVTTGLLETLPNDELAAVLAHELAHTRHYDATLLTALATPYLAGRGLLHGWWAAAANAPGIRAIGLVLALGLYVVPIGVGLVCLGAPIVILVARSREYRADRAAVAMTGSPGTLAAALRRLDGSTARPDADLRDLGPVGAFCIAPPAGRGLPWMHPATEKRIERLRDLERALESH